MKRAEATPGRLAVGLALGLLLALAAGQVYLGRIVSGFGGAAAQRTALVSLGAVADAVQAAGLGSPDLQAAIEVYDQANPAVSSIRVLHLGDRRLLASTVAADVEGAPAPRRLVRAEKPLYDLGQALRANVETNVLEGRTWKEEVSVERTPPGDESTDETADETADESAGADASAKDGDEGEGGDRVLYLAAPIEQGGEIAGTVLLEARPEPAHIVPPGFGLVSILLCLVPAILVLALGRLVTDRRILVAIATVLFVAALLIHAGHSKGALLDGRKAVETVMAERLGTEASRVRAALGDAPTEVSAISTEAWDMDLFRRPLGFQTADGVDEARLGTELGERSAALAKLTWFAGIVGLLLASFVGLGGAHRTWRTLVTHRQAYSYVIPALAGMLLLVFAPFFYGILLSFTNQSIYSTDKPLNEIWVGTENFTDILTDFEIVRHTEQGRQVNYQNFYWTLGFTIVWTVANVSVGVLLGLTLAIFLNTRGLRLTGIYRVLLILPWAMPNYITALIWKGMFHSQFGVINQVIQIFGGSPVSWFDTPFTSFLTVLSTNGWLSFPFMMVISLGALQSIPSDLYEAARVDGASKWQQLRAITLPSLKPALVPAIIISVVWTFNMFNIIYLVSEGEPGGSTEILITEAYKIAFEQYRYGYAAAYSTLIFLILLTYGVWQNHVTRATEGV